MLLISLFFVVFLVVIVSAVLLLIDHYHRTLPFLAQVEADRFKNDCKRARFRRKQSLN